MLQDWRGPEGFPRAGAALTLKRLLVILAPSTWRRRLCAGPRAQVPRARLQHRRRPASPLRPRAVAAARLGTGSGSLPGRRALARPRASGSGGTTCPTCPRGRGQARLVSQSRTVNICISPSRLANGGRVRRRSERGGGRSGGWRRHVRQHGRAQAPGHDQPVRADGGLCGRPGEAAAAGGPLAVRGARPGRAEPGIRPAGCGAHGPGRTRAGVHARPGWLGAPGGLVAGTRLGPCAHTRRLVQRGPRKRCPLGVGGPRPRPQDAGVLGCEGGSLCFCSGNGWGGADARTDTLAGRKGGHPAWAELGPAPPTPDAVHCLGPSAARPVGSPAARAPRPCALVFTYAPRVAGVCVNTRGPHGRAADAWERHAGAATARLCRTPGLACALLAGGLRPPAQRRRSVFSRPGKKLGRPPPA